jgi:flagellar biosynthesis/type III secretory pathway M-ring protein FliF/YscJ
VFRGIPLTRYADNHDAQEGLMPHATPDLTTPIIYPIGWLLLLIWFGFIGALIRRVIRKAKEEAAKKQANRQRRTMPRREEA